ncbi:MAG: cyclase family protein [Planctomycetaceae bacterium]
MSRLFRYISLVVVAVVVGSLAGGNDQQETPAGPKWWPSPWGPEDQRGAANRITPQKVLEAVQLIKTGRMYQLGHVYEAGMPLFGSRHYSLTIPGAPTYPPMGKNGVVGFDELFSGEIGQVGTQFDGLGHIGVRIGDDDYFYNGFRRSQFATPYGLQKLGIENVGPIFTRGLLLDVAAQRKTPRLPGGYVITPGDLQACLESAKLAIRPGDAVLIHTGHGSLWMKDNAAYGGAAPGIGIEAARWLSEQQIVLVGADTSGIEVNPPEDPERPIPVHIWNITRNGIYNHENLDLTELAADKVYEFAYIFSPLRLKGATGSPGNPIAVK